MTTSGQKKTLNVALKMAVLESTYKQGEVARRCDIGEVRFSQIVNGQRKPATADERAAIAKFLDKSEAALFGASDESQEAQAS